MKNEIQVVLSEKDALNTYTVHIERSGGIVSVMDCKGERVALLHAPGDAQAVQAVVEKHLQNLIDIDALSISSFTPSWYDW